MSREVRKIDQSHLVWGNPGPNEADGLTLMGLRKSQSQSQHSSAKERESK